MDANGDRRGSPGEQARRAALADCLPVPVRRCRAEGSCDYVNRAWTELTGRTAEQELGLGWLDRVHPDDRDRCLAAIGAAFAAGEPFTVEFRLLRADGIWRWLRECGAPCDEGEAYACCAEDVHRARRVAHALARAAGALREREMLLVELRHRAKNTVQLIGSLVSLLARRVEAASVPAVRELARRVRAFGLAHESLHRGRMAGEVDLGRYLGEVAGGLLELAEGRDVRLDVRTERVMMSFGRAAPLGLAVNELVTNALKYAFPDGRGGVVTVEVRERGEDGAVLVSVADDGIGLPADAWPPQGARSLGMSLVAGLARQAGAAVSVERGDGDGGTRFVLTVAAADSRPGRVRSPAPAEARPASA